MMAATRCRSGHFLRAAALAAAWALLSPALALAQSALQLGSTAYVTFGDPAKLKLAQFTVETWFRRDGVGTPASTGTGGIAGFLPLVTKGAAQAEGSNVDANFLLGIDTAGNVIAADFEEGTGGTGPLGLNHPVSGVTPIVNGVWYHAAATYDGATWRLYLNGVLEAELPVNQPVRSDSIQHAALGTTLQSTGVQGGSPGHFDGALDEARIWSVARSATDIRSTINSQLTSGTNLVARWGLDDGSGTTVADSIPLAANGTIVNAGFSWVAGAPFDLAACSNNDNVMLRYDGSNDYVTFGNAAELGLTTFTIETWFVRTAAGTSNTTGGGGIANLVPLVAKGAPEADGSNVDANYILGINTTGNVLAADFEDTATGLNHPVSGTTPIVNNRWYHAAATYDGSTWRLYLNGAPEVTLAVGAFTPRFDSIQHAGLGAMLTSTGTRLGAFAGVLDEVRIWNVAKSAAQVSAEYQQQITSASGLVARWGLDEGTGTTTADSVSAPSTTGTLTNGPLWVLSNTLFSRVAACSDAVFCNGPDTCNGDGLRCTLHAGDPCTTGGECADSCNEAADNCFDLAGTSCTSDGEICTVDACNGSGACAHPAGNPGVLCRGGSGDLCDPDELCDGSTPSCPADVVAIGGTVCDPGSGDLCDPDETCTGIAGQACPADVVTSAGTLCRGGSGDACDPSELCTGVAGQACPSDVVAPGGTLCRAGSGDVCDPNESCTGLPTQPCPADVVSGPSVTCRAAAGTCDVAETCTGTAGQGCPPDAVAPNTTACRPAAGDCDLAETCDGTNPACPADAVKPAATTCRPLAGVCDTPETCDGATAACPADAKSTGQCRAAAGICDVAESCDGAADTCPADVFQPSSTVCRPSTGTCDIAETCTGSGAACPVDTGLPDTDGDAVCDALDNCAAVANPGQQNGDADTLGDVCDPCTNVIPTGQEKSKLTLTKLLAPAGDEKLTFKGFFTDVPGTPTIDPIANGLRIVITDSLGANPVDVTVPGGAYDAGTKTGWRVNGSGTAWTYKGPGTGAANGVQKAQLKAIPSPPGKYKFSVKGKDGNYPVNSANLPLVGTIVIDVPLADTGQCGEATFAAPATCASASGGKTVKCK